MRIKRILTTLLIALMMCSMVAVTSFAAGADAQSDDDSFGIGVEMSSDSLLSEGFVQNTEEGVTVDFTLKLVNNPGVSSITIKMAYDTDKLTPVGDPSVNDEVFGSWDLQGAIAKDGIIDISFLTLAKDPAPSSEDCDFITFSFKVDASIHGKITSDDLKFTDVRVRGLDSTTILEGAENADALKEFSVHHVNPDDSWVVTTDPTCTENGVETKTCSVCGYTETQDVPASGHNYEAVVTAPTCTEDGFTTHTCSVCGDSYVDTEVDALGHKWGDWKETKAPTTSAKGESTRTCEICGATETKEIPKLPLIIESDDEWVEGEGWSFVVDTAEGFKGVLVDGEELDKDEYTVEEDDGNTVITLLDEYLETLDAGEYEIAIEFESGTAEGTFEIAGGGAWWIILLVAAVVILVGGGVACIFILTKKREND